ncbi:MAG: hypothetical protein J6T01_02930 [Kiritimatiellae bacterium]|nr:hypothetical protein [Kiritimatiellia bacterium]
MKKLICAVAMAGAMFAMADEAKTASAAVPSAPAAEVKADKASAPSGANRRALTDEQRAKFREQREKFMAERRAAMDAKMLEVIKKYGLDDEKAKALLKDLRDAIRPPRRMMRKPPKPAGKAD